MKLSLLNPAVRGMQAYVDLIAPWFSNQWVRADFESPEVIEARMDPSHTIFPMPLRPLPGWFERFLLGPKRAEKLDILISWVERFNSTNLKLEATGPLDRMEICILLHAGVIGTKTSNAGHASWAEAKASL